MRTLNEFVAVAVRKLAMPWLEVLEALRAIRVLCPSRVPRTVRTHDAGLGIAERYGYRIYDSLAIAAALEALAAAPANPPLYDRRSNGHPLS